MKLTPEICTRIHNVVLEADKAKTAFGIEDDAILVRVVAEDSIQQNLLECLAIFRAMEDTTNG